MTTQKKTAKRAPKRAAQTTTTRQVRRGRPRKILTIEEHINQLELKAAELEEAAAKMRAAANALRGK